VYVIEWNTDIRYWTVLA